jgi:hypothetical protein
LTNFLNTVPIWAIMAGTAALIFAMNEVGFVVGRSRAAKPGTQGPTALVLAAALTLIALLLAFSFSLALNRYDARRAVFVQEANSIGTTFLRASLLDDKDARAVRSDLRQYVALRIDFARADADPNRREIDTVKSDQLQDDLWAAAIRAARLNPRSTALPLFISTLNDTIDLSTTEGAILTAHIPDVIMLGLIFIILIAAGMMGFGFGRYHQRATVPKVLYAVMLALAIGMVLDLDRPQRGLVRIDLTPMIALQHYIETERQP